MSCNCETITSCTWSNPHVYYHIWPVALVGFTRQFICLTNNYVSGWNLHNAHPVFQWCHWPVVLRYGIQTFGEWKRQSTKLRESNVFTGVCVSIGGMGGLVWVGNCLWSHIISGRVVSMVPGPFWGWVSPGERGGWVYLGWVCPVQMGICPEGTHPPWTWDGGGVLTTPRHGIQQDTPGKRVVRMLLECFLVVLVNMWSSIGSCFGWNSSLFELTSLAATPGSSFSSWL